MCMWHDDVFEKCNFKKPTVNAAATAAGAGGSVVLVVVTTTKRTDNRNSLGFSLNFPFPSLLMPPMLTFLGVYLVLGPGSSFVRLLRKMVCCLV